MIVMGSIALKAAFSLFRVDVQEKRKELHWIGIYAVHFKHLQMKNLIKISKIKKTFFVTVLPCISVGA
jgi:hypothetical protein